ncbi:MAG: PadR family transcriptional regulator [Proteobacteria bacterium]|nr:PadR family transcriptional regulator [Pseudomonadota bacterium]
MDVELIALGFLMSGPKTGYQLRTITKKVLPFYPISLNQIYPMLRKLEKAGYVEKDVVPQQGRPDKNVFRLTRSGRERFLNKLVGDPVPLDHGLPFTERAYFFRFLEPARVIEAFEEEVRALELQLAEVERGREGIRAKVDEHGLFSFDTAGVVIRALLDWYRGELAKRKQGLENQ